MEEIQEVKQLDYDLIVDEFKKSVMLEAECVIRATMLTKEELIFVLENIIKELKNG